MAQRVVDQGDLKKYRTEIPNIVLTLGLSPYELTLYVHLKKTAGGSGDGVCWKSTATLAKESGMSSGMVSKAKIGLQREFAALGSPLITVAEESNAKGGKPKHCITLIDIWTQNFKRKGTSSPHEVEPSPNSHSERASSSGEVASSPHEFTSSPGEIKKEPSEERTLEERKEPSAHALLMEFHASHLKGPIPDAGAQGGAIKWLTSHYAVDVLQRCYESQFGEKWRARVSWLTVRSEIGSWLSRNGNGSNKQSTGNGSHSEVDFVFQPKSKVC